MVTNASLYWHILNCSIFIYQATKDIGNPFGSEFYEHLAIDKCYLESFQFE